MAVHRYDDDHINLFKSDMFVAMERFVNRAEGLVSRPCTSEQDREYLLKEIETIDHAMLALLLVRE